MKNYNDFEVIGSVIESIYSVENYGLDSMFTFIKTNRGFYIFEDGSGSSCPYDGKIDISNVLDFDINQLNDTGILDEDEFKDFLNLDGMSDICLRDLGIPELKEIYEILGRRLKA